MRDRRAAGADGGVAGGRHAPGHRGKGSVTHRCLTEVQIVNSGNADLDVRVSMLIFAVAKGREP